MSSEKIIIFIDPQQVTAQKNNNYSLYLAKKVNGTFTVIWQSKGPVATVNQPSYEYKNTFIIQVPSYQVNYGSTDDSGGTISFSSAGKAMTINSGQTVLLDKNGIFGSPQNNGAPGVVRINNQLQGNPHEVLTDNKGNPIFFNAASGMDIGPADLTPVDEYQLWFDNYQATGTMIAHNASNPGLVKFAGEDSLTISYTAAGAWIAGSLEAKRRLEAEEALGGGLAVIVAATFTTALTTTAVAYLTSQLVSKFAPDLRPSSLKVAVGSLKLEVTFRKADHAMLADDGLSRYEQALESALAAARMDQRSGLAGEQWTLDQPQIEVHV